MSRFVVVVTLLVASTAFIASCGHYRSRSGAERTTLEVDNQGFTDMTMYVLNGGQRIRLGLAVGKSATTFTIPASVVGSGRELQFLADPVGSSRAAISEQMYVRAGEAVHLVIPP